MLNMSRWNPFEEMVSFHRDFDCGFGRRVSQCDWDWSPAVEVTSGKEDWTITVALPGINPEDVQVSLDHNVLTIKGERRAENAEKHLSEFSYGSFERRFTVPDNVDTERVSGKFENGMLTLTLPLTEATKPKQIKIASSSNSTKKAA